MPRRCWVCCSIAVEMRNEGGVEGGLLTLAMHQSALRPGEATQLEDEDVTLPEETLMLEMTDRALLRVAPGGRPAKVGRPQPAECDPGVGVIALRALKLRARRFKRARLYPREGPEYAKGWKRGAEKRKLDVLGTTPHRARAGWATEARHSGMEGPELQRRERWGSWGSARVYFDQVGAMAAAQRLPEAVQWRVMETVRHLFREVPELAEGLREAETPPHMEPKENPRRRGPVAPFAPRVEAKTRRSALGSRLFEM